jgi:hypothetical protein
MGAMHQQRASRSRIGLRWATAVVVLLVVSVALWVGVRAMIARDELLGAVPIANRIGTEVLSDSSALADDLDELQNRSEHAAALTSDPIWRVAEATPFLGANLTAFREAAAIIDGLASNALPPLATLADTFTLDSLQPAAGKVDLTVFAEAQPLLGDARTALASADSAAKDIDTQSTIPQIGSAVDQVVELVAKAKGAIDNLDTAATLIPSMLGADGPRSYLLLSLNNAELRATGGLPGAIAVLETDNGSIGLGALSSATTLGEFDEPVLDLTEPEKTLYGEILGTYMHDVTYTPDFARSGELAQAMWLERTGQTVDGVVAIDPVALGYILSATGPVDAGSDVVLTSENAADVLLSDVYAMFDDPKDQDLFFANATSKIFSTVTAGETSGVGLIDSLARGTRENRIHIWSANDDEQERLAGTGLEGAVPVSDEFTTAYGVYFNDATGAKMDYYLTSEIAIASGVCRNDQRPNFEVKVRVSSSAPLDAATSLPEYVTGGGDYGVTPGNIRTNVFVYAPEGSIPFSVTIDGQEYAFVSTDHDGHSVAGMTVELGPGETAVVSMKFLGVAGAAEPVTLQHTPMVEDVATSLDNYLDCDGLQPAPTEDEEEQSGALGLRNLGDRVRAFD